MPPPPPPPPGEVDVSVLMGLRPVWPPGSPRGLVAISMRCWAEEEEARPSFLDIIVALNRLEADLGS